MLVLIKGAGDLASGVAYRLYRTGINVAMTDLAYPTSIRRTVCFSEAIPNRETMVEGVRACFAMNADAAKDILLGRCIPVMPDPEANCILELKPDVVVDAILAKKNLGTSITDAPAVIALGPGFTAGTDCHAVVETMRGHSLGRVYYGGGALPNTGVPGSIGGFTIDRLLRAPRDGVFIGKKKIGDYVRSGDVCALVDGEPMAAAIDGVLRGLLPDGTKVRQGMKSGDVDPRANVAHCYSISDKALSIGGGVLEAILSLTGVLRA